MRQVRICENEICGHYNDATLSRCEKCSAKIWQVNPVMDTEDGTPEEKSQQQASSPFNEQRQTTTLKRIKLVSTKDGFSIEIPTVGCIIGREGDVEPHYFARNEYVSRYHARIYLEGSRYFIVDDNSRNGTMLNEQTLPKNKGQKVTPGNRIVIADMEFLVQEL